MCNKAGISFPKQVRWTDSSEVWKNVSAADYDQKLVFSGSDSTKKGKQWKASILLGKEKDISLWKGTKFPTIDACSISVLSLIAYNSYIEI